MKVLLEIAVGLVASLGMFGIGIAVATAVLTDELAPQPGVLQSVAFLWTDEPRRVDPAAQDFERLPARPVPIQKTYKVATAFGILTDPVSQLVDATLTASTQSSADESLGGMENPPHVQWCAERYRSYSRQDDSYTSFSGRRRPCLSPYANGAARAVANESFSDGADPTAMLQYALYDVDNVGTSRHVRNCFSRYRSYRPEDNTYQPFDGGRRRQCR